MSASTFFTRDDRGRFLPTVMAHSRWGPDALNGPALCAVAACVVESEHTAPGWRPARFTVELFKSARALPTTVTTEVQRAGGRIRVITFRIQQDDGAEQTLVAQGVTVFLKESTNPPGARWSPPESARTFFPPDVPADDAAPRFGGPDGWGRSLADQQHAHRHRLWSEPIPVAPDIALTPFQRAVITAESTSLMTNWGEGGIGFINCDLTVALSRLPEGPRIGVEADGHDESDGISVGTATLYDARGRFGTGLVTAVENSRAFIDFSTDVRPPGWTPQA
ncbi:acyl-CoA thioesterase domain-containing protein [Gordonia sp. (in: high G+C Gram-positive bacteria)]|uniref:acyl-CoA thioesterase domain-containing protein n=1 Tax=Gordonia sp. (in: high G+C Gram-positive bacteria) TaxID=84139 RepID=UPI0026224EE3|nr:acyl-CoA thioesterase domain-containing protein [Gordonia sp. (in: high G+C Gram-positive bacteria)]